MGPFQAQSSMNILDLHITTTWGLKKRSFFLIYPEAAFWLCGVLRKIPGREGWLIETWGIACVTNLRAKPTPSQQHPSQRISTSAPQWRPCWHQEIHESNLSVAHLLQLEQLEGSKSQERISPHFSHAARAVYRHKALYITDWQNMLPQIPRATCLGLLTPSMLLDVTWNFSINTFHQFLGIPFDQCSILSRLLMEPKF